MDDDDALLRSFLAGDEQAFAALVERRLGLVYGVALRRTGDSELAREIAQNVFAALARKASELKSGVVLSGWLQRAAVLESATMFRAESTRRRKMEELSEARGEAPHQPPSEWDDAILIIDESLAQLDPGDRGVLMLRYFEDRTFREIGDRIGRSESAAKRRADRALAKLGRLLGRKGVSIAGAALAANLAAELAKAAPCGMGRTVSEAALASASAAGPLTTAAASSASSATITSQLIVAMSKHSTITFLAAAGILAALFTGGGYLVGTVFRPDPAPLPEAAEAADAGSEEALPSASGAPAADLSAARNRVAGILDRAAALLRTRSYAEAAEEVEELLARLSAADIPEALEHFDSIDGEGVRMPLGAMLFEHLAEDGGEEVVEAAMETPRQDGHAFVWAAVKGWAREDAAAVYRYYETLNADSATDARVSRGVLGLLFRDWVRTDPEVALRTFEALPYDEQKVAARSFDAVSHPDELPQRAALVERIHDEKLRLEVIGDLGERWAKRDLAAATAWFDTLEFDNQAGAFEAAAELAEDWFDRDPAGALDWLWPKATDRWRDEIIESVTEEWMERDPAAAKAWLESKGVSLAEETGE